MTKLHNKLAAFGFVTFTIGGAALMSAAPALARSMVEYQSAPSEAAASSYQNSDGSYRSYSDFVRDLNGTPCGITCGYHAVHARLVRRH
ncbi:hypothetical protein [Methylovirgula sp. HY1]|uniref:hypothetical protein n=1 Tax=Methylovirgula sp. HY1 TaxID=2822761 RepID=UPI001C5AA402|nr:hypothetical protein [Methylovirgula sp. HY1]QXX76575.1 hypothetical protein MHY1_p00097 [Methylovirgula sp. HY1]